MPPVAHAFQTMVDHQAAAVSFELGAGAHQLFALPMQGAALFLRFTRDADDGQGVAVAFQIAIEAQAKGFGVAPIGLHALVSFVQLLWRDDVAVDAQGAELTLQGKAKAARFVDGVDLAAALGQLLRPEKEGGFAEALRRLGRPLFLLPDDDVLMLVDIDSELAHARAGIKLSAGCLE